MTGRSGELEGLVRLATLGQYGPVQLAEFLGLGRWQLDRALASGLICGPDTRGGKWSAAVAWEAAARIGDIRAAVGGIPDLGAVRAAEVLTGRLGMPVTADGVNELGRCGLLPVTGNYKGFPLYDGRALETFADAAAAAEASRAGQLRTAGQAASYLRIRRSDFSHVIRARLLTPSRQCRGPFDRRDSRSVPLYRTRDLDDLAAAPGIDWDAVRATPKGRRSLLASFPSASRPAWPARPDDDDTGETGVTSSMTRTRDTWT